MQIYHYHPVTGFILGSGQADPDPLDNPGGDPSLPFLIPANATAVAPPETVEGQARAFRDGSWMYVEIEPPAEEPEALPPSSGDVDAERNRRISAGFTFEGVLYQSDGEARENIMGAHKAASDAMMLFGAQPGNLAWRQLLDPAAPEVFEWIASDNSRIAMDAPTVLRFGYAALAHKAGHIFAASDLKSISPIPNDFATNSDYWP
ncbi:DUF4376 domain-containing protein [Neorhizobium galegae]|uniref:DUF4376 domain-containing protein n=1 Tax=Neorhizobium galegae TaxID=399 RepID=UPI0006227DB5|nr:DUF4376 domain-containing protein [Neorhizobium galegae]CDZ50423.1 Hypothetical protein NGAL_HAMBI2427_36410 [Neorhizobium galegae bv. orientalis]